MTVKDETPWGPDIAARMEELIELASHAGPMTESLAQMAEHLVALTNVLERNLAVQAVAYAAIIHGNALLHDEEKQNYIRKLCKFATFGDRDGTAGEVFEQSPDREPGLYDEPYADNPKRGND